MQHRTPLLAVAALVLTTAAAQADLGDQLFKLLADDGAPVDNFGRSAAISGNIAVVGSLGDDDNGSGSGSAYLFDTSMGVQVAKLLPNDGAAWDRFGGCVSISGTTVIVGAAQDDNYSGSAYLFDISDPANWMQTFKLLSDDGAVHDMFGYSVAISGSTAVVGAKWDDDNGSNSGSAYLFNTTTGQQVAKLLPDDGAAGHRFGYSVAISGATAIVGAIGDNENGDDPSSAYLFDTTTGQQLAKLQPDLGAEWYTLEVSVAISGTTAIIGISGGEYPWSGSAYLFDTATGQQTFTLLSDDPGDRFADSVAISGPTAIVGAWSDDDNGSFSGSAYLFDTTTGTQIAKLLPDDGAAGAHFGDSVAINGSTAIVGANRDDDNGFTSGSAYLFDAAGCPPDSDGDGLVTICHIPPGNPDNAHTITVGANAVPAHLAHGDHCGPCEGDSGVLLIIADGEACLVDLNGDIVVDAFDLAALLGSWGPCPGCPADLFVDGIVDASDLAILLGDWGPCP